MRSLLELGEARVAVKSRLPVGGMPDLKHVEVVVVSRRGIGRERQALAEETAHRLPARADVACDAPAVGDVGDPRTGEGPAADVELDVPSGRANGLRNLGVARTLVESELGAAAVVDLDVVEPELLEVKVAVGRVVAVEAGPLAAAAHVRTRVRIDAGLQALRVDAVRNGLHPLREPLQVPLENALLIVSVEESVIRVDVEIASRLESVRCHCHRLRDNLLRIDVEPEAVPARPAHQRTLRRVRQHGRGEHRLGAPHGRRDCRVLFRGSSLKARAVDARRLSVVRIAGVTLALRTLLHLDACRTRKSGAQRHQRQHGTFHVILLSFRVQDFS